MTDTQPSFFRRWLGRAWWLLDSGRRLVINLLFLAILVAVAVALFSGDSLKIKDKTALVLNFSGTIVEQQSGGGVRQRALQEAQGAAPRQTQLRDVFAVLEAAAKDPKIDRVVLVLDEFEGAGMATLREVAAALERFKASGKQVVAWGSGYTQKQYYLAAHAGEVYMHPMGMAYLDGFGRLRNYYKDALDRLGLQANVVRAGAYKSFGEVYVANAPSPQTTEADSYLLNDLWANYTGGVEKARKLPAGSINKMIEEIVPRFAAANNDAAKFALQAKLVDGLKTRDELRQLMIERGAADDEDKDNKTFRQVSFSAYADSLKSAKKPSDDSVAVVVAKGEISDGVAGPGSIGGRSTSELIRRAREDKSVKAVVLRVDSPGGSAFGSELIRRELELTRAAGKPVVVSMGDVAASGGYWISMAADEVIADATTITGSIGVFSILPSASKAMEKLSLNAAGYHTTWLGSAVDPRRPLDPRMEALVQGVVNNIYTDFTTKAASARKTTVEAIDKVAQGRVWTGTQAKERGLIDRVGSFADAVKSAASKAKLPDDVQVRYMERSKGTFERILLRFGVSEDAATSVLASAIGQLIDQGITQSSLGQGVGTLASGLPRGVLGEAAQELSWLANGASMGAGLPYTVVTHCLCGK